MDLITDLEFQIKALKSLQQQNEGFLENLRQIEHTDEKTFKRVITLKEKLEKRLLDAFDALYLKTKDHSLTTALIPKSIDFLKDGVSLVTILLPKSYAVLCQVISSALDMVKSVSSAFEQYERYFEEHPVNLKSQSNRMLLANAMANAIISEYFEVLKRVHQDSHIIIIEKIMQRLHFVVSRHGENFRIVDVEQEMLDSDVVGLYGNGVHVYKNESPQVNSDDVFAHPIIRVDLSENNETLYYVPSTLKNNQLSCVGFRRTANVENVFNQQKYRRIVPIYKLPLESSKMDIRDIVESLFLEIMLCEDLGQLNDIAKMCSAKEDFHQELERYLKTYHSDNVPNLHVNSSIPIPTEHRGLISYYSAPLLTYVKKNDPVITNSIRVLARGINQRRFVLKNQIRAEEIASSAQQRDRLFGNSREHTNLIPGLLRSPKKRRTNPKLAVVEKSL